ncbi:hypothetical protein [Streptomyces sp. NPDC004008]
MNCDINVIITMLKKTSTAIPRATRTGTTFLRHGLVWPLQGTPMPLLYELDESYFEHDVLIGSSVR